VILEESDPVESFSSLLWNVMAWSSIHIDLFPYFFLERSWILFFMQDVHCIWYLLTLNFILKCLLSISSAAPPFCRIETY
jgi:hypothetical protein